MENKNFSLLISHFLGVDHCGHRYGPNHPEMKRKLNEMDDVVANVIDKLDEKTILFVFGDHGMDPYGNHGGDALLEVEAALFVYSKKSLPSISDDKYSTVSQIDLLPTISLLLDIPIPFSNLGALIEDLFNESSLNLARKMNVMQVMRYISTYNFQNPSVQVI
jgi:phosphatidylinositol glycan class O